MAIQSSAESQSNEPSTISGHGQFLVVFGYFFLFGLLSTSSQSVLDKVNQPPSFSLLELRSFLAQSVTQPEWFPADKNAFNGKSPIEYK